MGHSFSGSFNAGEISETIRVGPNMTVGHFFVGFIYGGGGRGDLEDAPDQQRANIAPPLLKASPESTGPVLLNLSSTARTLHSLVLNYRKSQTSRV